MQLALITCAASLAAFQVQGKRMTSSVEIEANSTDEEYCCCKRKKCEVDAASWDERKAVYSPQLNLCCKFKTWSCSNPLSFSGYKIEAPNNKYCEVMQDWLYTKPDGGNAHEYVNPEDLTPGSAEHTVHTYCEFKQGADAEDQESEATDGSRAVRSSLVNALASELADNSIDSMAKEIFSLYLCMRWAPSADFVRAGESEIATGQLDNKSSVLEHYTDSHFMPLRCTRNVNVYGDTPTLGKTHFEEFEKEMTALSQWYKSEAGNTLATRLERVQEVEGASLKSDAAAFDIEAVREVVAKCGEVGGPILVNVLKASTRELLGDCAAARWWLSKLEDWHRAMPFTSFMMPDASAAKEARPEKGEQVIVCFGKRVASQLHRREEGDHLMTDQSMVGCHGFWDLTMASKMLERIVTLWRPPTCQLAAMELDMKMKIMELMATMNTNLFDALPAMLVEEMGAVPDWDGKALEASSGLGIMRGVWKSMVKTFNSMRGQYARLGQLLGNTVTKWVVCPMKPITNITKLQQLDDALGTEDKLAQYYARTAYSKWTGEKDLLPGEECTREDADQKLPGFPSAELCRLGVMQESMPEPYHDEDFLCPVRPLLPAKQQLDVFKQKRDTCVLHMSLPQMKERKWFYRGHTPQRKQYNVTDNLPSEQYRYMKVIDMKSRPDTDFAIWRSFVTIGMRCTEAEMQLTPRWCQKPEIGNEPKVVSNLLTGAVSFGGKAVQGLFGEKTPSNKATAERLGQWLYGRWKGLEKWLKSSGEWVGRASTRYDRLYERSFDEVEANELLHSSSFQAALEKTGGDSKNRGQFDRYAVVAPCVDFDPSREFRLKYTWSENAISLARKAVQKFAEDGLLSTGAFSVQLRGDGVLSMRDERNAWMTYYTHLRASSIGKAPSQWIRTDNPYLQEMSGSLDPGSDKAVTASSLRGFQATFACGSRVAMHALSLNLESLPGDFARCVREGKERNEELRASQPHAAFFRDETVIRVTFAPLEDCYHEVDSKLVKSVNETKNPVYSNFMSMRSCGRLDPKQLPDDLRKHRDGDSQYRGMLLGNGVPQETLMEVLVDPQDFLMEVKM